MDLSAIGKFTTAPSSRQRGDSSPLASHQRGRKYTSAKKLHSKKTTQMKMAADEENCQRYWMRALRYGALHMPQRSLSSTLLRVSRPRVHVSIIRF